MDTFTSVDAAAGVQIFIVMLTGLALLNSGRLQQGMLGPSRSVTRLVVLYYGLCVLSFAWSPLHLYTLYRATEALVLLCATFAATSAARDIDDAERIWFTVSAITIALSMGQNVVLQGIGGMTTLHAWHTNTYTAVGAVLAVYCFGEYRDASAERRKRLKFFGLIGLGAVLLGTSSASNVSLIAGVIIVTILQRRHALLGGLVFASTAFYVYLSMSDGSLFAVFDWLFPGKEEAAVASLGGRTRIWGIYWQAILREPILGHGFAVLSLDSGHAIRLYSHNAFLAVVLGCGMFGAMVVFALLARLFFQALQAVRNNRTGAVGGGAALSTGLINSNSMPMIFDQWEESVVAFAAFLGVMAFFVWRSPRSAIGSVAERGGSARPRQSAKRLADASQTST